MLLLEEFFFVPAMICLPGKEMNWTKVQHIVGRESVPA